MTSRSERRGRCQPAARPPAGSHLTARDVDARKPGPEYWLGALDEPMLVHQVVATLRAGDELTDQALGTLYCRLRELDPLNVDWQDDQLVCSFMWVTRSAQAAAWKTVEELHGVDGAVLVQVEAGLPDEPTPRVVLTSDTDGRPDDGSEGALCA